MLPTLHPHLYSSLRVLEWTVDHARIKSQPQARGTLATPEGGCWAGAGVEGVYISFSLAPVVKFKPYPRCLD